LRLSGAEGVRCSRGLGAWLRRTPARRELQNGLIDHLLGRNNNLVLSVTWVKADQAASEGATTDVYASLKLLPSLHSSIVNGERQPADLIGMRREQNATVDIPEKNLGLYSGRLARLGRLK
jgi:hypothetical protein